VAAIMSQRVFGRADERHGVDVKSQGPDTPMLVLPAQCAQAHCRAMVANKPGAPGRLRISVKTIAQGRPGVLGCTCGTCRLHFFEQAGRRRQPTPGLPCALVSMRGQSEHKSSGASRREAADPCLQGG